MSRPESKVPTKSDEKSALALGDVSEAILVVLREASRYAPVPYLQDAAGMALAILNTVQETQENKEAFGRLANDACGLVYVVLSTYQERDGQGQKIDRRLFDDLQELTSTLTSIEKFTRREISRNRFGRWIRHKSDAEKIQEYRERLKYSLDVFGLQSSIGMREAIFQIAARQEELIRQQDNRGPEGGKSEQDAKGAESFSDAQTTKVQATRENRDLEISRGNVVRMRKSSYIPEAPQADFTNSLFLCNSTPSQVVTGEIYTITNLKSETVLDLSGGDGRTIFGFSAHGGNNQKWILEHVGPSWAMKSVSSGDYLGFQGVPKKNVRLRAVSHPVYWDIRHESDGTYRIYVPGTAITITLSDNGNSADCTPVVILGAINGANHQAWRFSETPTSQDVSPKSGNTYTIVDRKTLSVIDLSGSDGKSILGFAAHGSDNQKWIVEQGDSGWTIKSLESELYLGFDGDHKDGKPLQAVRHPVFWDIQRQGRGAFGIYVPNTSTNIELSNERPANHTVIRMTTTRGGNNWRLDEVITLEPGSVYKLMRVKSGTSVTVTDDEYHKIIGTDNLDDDEKQEWILERAGIYWTLQSVALGLYLGFDNIPRDKKTLRAVEYSVSWEIVPVDQVRWIYRICMPGVAGTDVAQGSVEDKTLDNQWCFLKI